MVEILGSTRHVSEGTGVRGVEVLRSLLREWDAVVLYRRESKAVQERRRLADSRGEEEPEDLNDNEIHIPRVIDLLKAV